MVQEWVVLDTTNWPSLEEYNKVQPTIFICRCAIKKKLVDWNCKIQSKGAIQALRNTFFWKFYTSYFALKSNTIGPSQF